MATEIRNFRLKKISLVDFGAQEGAHITHVAKRRPGAPLQENAAMADNDTDTLRITKGLEDQITVIKADLAKAVAWGQLSDVHKEHALTLQGAERDAFVAKGSSERDAVVKAAFEADEKYTTMEGVVLRKSLVGVHVISMAKQLDHQRTELAKQQVAAETAVLKARASTVLKHSTMGEDARVALLRQVGKIEDATVRGEVEKALEAYDNAAARPFSSIGTGGEGTGVVKVAAGSPQEKINTAVAKRMSDKGEDRGTALKAVMADPAMQAAYEDIPVPRMS